MCNIVEYDQKALECIKVFKHPEKGIFGSVVDAVNKPLEMAFDAVEQLPFFKEVLTKAASGLMDLLKDGATLTVREEAIFEEFRKDGYVTVRSHKDIHELSLEQIDKVVGRLAAKYNSLAAIEGAGTAAPALLPGAGTAATVAAIVADIPIFTGLCFRAIGEYATYYGFDLSLQEERQYAMKVMNYVVAPTDAVKQKVLMEMGKAARAVASKATWEELRKNVIVQILEELAKALGIRLTKGHLAALIPAAGMLFNSGFNVYFMDKVCDASYMFYRERHLARYYNKPQLIKE